MRRRVVIGAVILLLAGWLAGCLPTGGPFGMPEKQPRPEFAQSLVAPAAQIQERTG